MEQSKSGEMFIISSDSDYEPDQSRNRAKNSRKSIKSRKSSGRTAKQKLLTSWTVEKQQSSGRDGSPAQLIDDNNGEADDEKEEDNVSDDEEDGPPVVRRRKPRHSGVRRRRDIIYPIYDNNDSISSPHKGLLFFSHVQVPSSANAMAPRVGPEHEQEADNEASGMPSQGAAASQRRGNPGGPHIQASASPSDWEMHDASGNEAASSRSSPPVDLGESSEDLRAHAPGQKRKSRDPKGPGADDKKVTQARKAAVTDSFAYKLGIDQSLPPMHDINEIFDDMTDKAMELGLGETLQHFGAHRLKVATMCSGTEAPILALGLVSDSLRERHRSSLELQHQFSCELEDYKQAYIERNFSPPALFRDVREFPGNDEATTAYGALMPIPRDVDLLVAGCSCVDFSNLNIKKQSLEAGGESGDTFNGMMGWAKATRPPIIILENVVSAPWKYMQGLFKSQLNYATAFLKVDTKRYYVPHTRQRGYMICIDRERLPTADKAVEKWTKLMERFERPASSPVEAFLLSEDDPRIHRGREELAKGARGETRKDRDVDWTTCQGRHQDLRSALQLGNKRPVTGWEDSGSCKMPDFAWSDWGRVQVERLWDTFEISYLRNARRGFDHEYKTRVLELSQNVDFNKDTTPFGITGCLTPTGIPYVSTRGGPLVGLEALGMQGLPVDKLLLTRESQKDLTNLAGNAMSSTVVGAAILAALIIGHQAITPSSSQTESLLQQTGAADAILPTNLSGEGDLIRNLIDLQSYERTPLADILPAASNSRRLCICEGRSLVTRSKVQKCRLCGHTTCIRCGGNPKHDYAVYDTGLRIPPGNFENILKDALPMVILINGISLDTLDELRRKSVTIKVDDNWKLLLAGIETTLGVPLRYHSISRKGRWTVTYDSPTSRLDLILDQSKAEWQLFAKSAPSQPGNDPTRILLARPFARMIPRGNDIVQGDWEFFLPAKHTFSVHIKGHEDPEGKLYKSWEAKIGLQEPCFADAKVWPTLSISLKKADASHLDLDISGEYDLLPDCGMACRSLHKRREDSKTTEPLFLFLDPSRYGDWKEDYFVFSSDIRRLNYGDNRSVIARLDKSWRPTAADREKRVLGHVAGEWIALPQASIQPGAAGDVASLGTAPPGMNFSTDDCSSAKSLLKCIIQLSAADAQSWPRGEWQDCNKPNTRSLFSQFSWLAERARRIPGLNLWKSFPATFAADRCTVCAPKPPRLRWSLEKKGNKAHLVPYEDPAQAAPYEQALKHRPPPFTCRVTVHENREGHLEVALNATTLAHRAFTTLTGGTSATSVEMSWRINTDYSAPTKSSLPRFRLSSNKTDEPANQPPKFRLELRIEQLRSLSWMISQEDGIGRTFVEEEVEETLLPPLGWRAEVSAKKSMQARGGVLADQVGYGKTAITLGLIDSMFRREKNGKQPEMSCPASVGKISLKATLIVVPPHLSQQWYTEVKKFLGVTYTVLFVPSMQRLAGTTLRKFSEADIIITTGSLLENVNYLDKLAWFAALPEMPSASGRAFEAWFNYAMEKTATHLGILQAIGPKLLYEQLEDIRESTEQDEELHRFVPSKRFRGAAYQASKQKKPSGRVTKSGKQGETDESADSQGGSGAKSKATLKAATKSGAKATGKAASKITASASTTPAKHGRKHKIDDVDDAEIHEPKRAKDNAHKKAHASDSKSKKAKSKSSEEPSDPFHLLLAKDLSAIRSPLFHMFHFNRIVVDEYTYVIGKGHHAILKLAASSRWVLSGTPPLGDFADVKTMAAFLGINLGVDDDTPGVIKANNIKQLQRERTDVERFQAFKSPKSPAWHENRHGLAQRFLEQFVRQNVPEIDAIPSERHIRAVTLPAAERAVYLELRQYVMSHEMKLKKTKAKAGGDRHKRLMETIGDSNSAGEALIKRCSHRSAEEVTDGLKNAADACQVIVNKRALQLKELKTEIRTTLKHAAWLKSCCGKNDMHFENWVGSVKSHAYGDSVVEKQLLSMISVADSRVCAEDEVDFYDHVRALKAKKAADEAAAAEKKNRRKKKKAADSDEIDDEAEETEETSEEEQTAEDVPADVPEDGAAEDETTPEPQVAPPDAPSTAVTISFLDKIRALRELASHLRLLSLDFVDRVRSLRFFQVVQAIQLEEHGASQDVKRPEILKCADGNCKSAPLLEQISVLSTCGHVACQECLSKHLRNEECAARGCTAVPRDYSIQKATELADLNFAAIKDRYYGQKLEQVLSLIKEQIPPQDQILLFVQFESQMHMVRSALEDRGISHSALLQKSGHSADTLTRFQNDKSQKKKRVLVLNIADESAAGSNLTNANHIIFLSPLLADSQYKYESSMTQAIGRAQRYGQTKVVHIYQFMALKTIDVDIIEARERGKLIETAPGQYELIPRADINVGDSPYLGGGALKNIIEETDSD